MTDDRMDARLRAAGETWRATAGRATATSEAIGDGAVETLDTRRPHHTRRTGLLASAAVVAAALVAGGAFLIGNGGGPRHQSAATAGLEGTVWRLVQVGNAPLMPNSLSTMYIGQDGNLVADDSCSVVGEQVDVHDGHVYPNGTFDLRYRDCTDAVGELTFGDGFDLLTHFPSYEIAGDGLTLSAAGQPAMHFTASPALLPPTTDVPTFLGATWRLTKVVDGHQVDHPLNGRPTLRVSNGRLTASDGCNTISAAASATGQQVDLKNVALSTVGCTGTAGETAAAIDAFFTTDGLHEQIDGTTLTIKGGGVGYLMYVWQPDDPDVTKLAALVNTTWMLQSSAGTPAVGAASLRFPTPTTVVGTDGCTHFSGSAVLDAGSMALNLNLGPASACVPGGSEQATTVDGFLNARPALWAIRGGKLLIYGGGAQAFALVYRTDQPSSSVKAPNSGSLSGHPWNLVGIEQTGGNTSSGEGSSSTGVTLTFDGSGAVKLDPGCGEYTGAYVIAPHTVAFAALADHSGSKCVIDQLTGRVARVLNGTVGWKIDKGQLLLTKGSTTLTFNP